MLIIGTTGSMQFLQPVLQQQKHVQIKNEINCRITVATGTIYSTGGIPLSVISPRIFSAVFESYNT